MKERQKQSEKWTARKRGGGGETECKNESEPYNACQNGNDAGEPG